MIYQNLNLKDKIKTLFIDINLNLFTILNLKNKIKTLLGFSVTRQPYLITHIDMNKTNSYFLYKKLIQLGYSWNYFSYYDEGEIINVRKLYGKRQVHVRIFKDGEVRVHSELNYEFYPVEHIKGLSFREANDEHIFEIRKCLME